MENKYHEYGPALLRLTLGAMFLFTGISKLLNPDGIISMLSNLGFPASGFLGWVVLLSELIFGLSILIGWRVKYTVWPLVIILLVAVVTVVFPMTAQDPMAWINVFFHFVGIAALISLALTGPGRIAVSEH